MKYCINCESEFVSDPVTNSDFCSDACKAEFVTGADASIIANAQALTQELTPVTKQLTENAQSQSVPDGKRFFDLLTNSGKLKDGD